jgi:hypothetical protein
MYDHPTFKKYPENFDDSLGGYCVFQVRHLVYKAYKPGVETPCTFENYPEGLCPLMDSKSKEAFFKFGVGPKHQNYIIEQFTNKTGLYMQSGWSNRACRLNSRGTPEGNCYDGAPCKGCGGGGRNGVPEVYVAAKWAYLGINAPREKLNHTYFLEPGKFSETRPPLTEEIKAVVEHETESGIKGFCAQGYTEFYDCDLVD